ncbi:hypothetical protein TR51_30390 [Kitasatospora griseola]|uniref:Uncharacterized protein n=1 Tax=Kitasatospora griseola TaxID=2064 RepID=A0A0D0NY01_KITGR|nr:hypothetical protein [Kitasatospora griseola]KIQ64111.1 hypothetical protein TR51_30390 [Kitasatospora griseola]
MMHQMRAETGPDGATDSVVSWHIVRNADLTALCGKTLSTAAPVQDATRWTLDPDRNCHTCGALFLREAPYFPDEHTD